MNRLTIEETVDGWRESCELCLRRRRDLHAARGLICEVRRARCPVHLQYDMNSRGTHQQHGFRRPLGQARMSWPDLTSPGQAPEGTRLQQPTSDTAACSCHQATLDVDNEAVVHLAGLHSLHGAVDFVDADALDHAGNRVLAAEVQHLLRLLDGADGRPRHDFAPWAGWWWGERGQLAARGMHAQQDTSLWQGGLTKGDGKRGEGEGLWGEAHQDELALGAQQLKVQRQVMLDCVYVCGGVGGVL